MAPIFFDYPRSEMGLKKVHIALATFEKYLTISQTKYAAADTVTLADFALASATLCLEGIDFSLNEYQLIKKWYETFKREYPNLWAIGAGGMKEIAEFNKNPPNLSHMNHPIHPVRKNWFCNDFCNVKLNLFDIITRTLFEILNSRSTRCLVLALCSNADTSCWQLLLERFRPR